MPRISTIPPVTSPVEGSFNGHPVITLPDPDDVKNPGVQMGVKKLRAVLSNIEAVKEFITKNHKPKEDALKHKLVEQESKNQALVAALKQLGVSPEQIAALGK